MDDILKDIFEAKRKKRYRQKLTLRDFSRFSGINVATRSRVLSGKETLSVKQAEKIIANKNIDDQFKSKLVSKYFPSLSSSLAAFRKRESELFEREIQDFDYTWLDIALLELFNIENAKQSPEVLATIFSVTTDQITQSIGKLEKCGLIHFKAGRYRRSDLHVFFRDANQGASAKFRDYLRDLALRGISELNKASQKDLQSRLVNSITIATHRSKVAEEKRRIEAFQDELTEFLMERHQEANEVYVLNSQFFSLGSILSEGAPKRDKVDTG